MYHNNASSVTTASVKLDPQCKLFIGGLSYETTDESLAAYFSRFGEIAQSAVMRDADTGRSRGFGFVTFRTQDCAQDALRATHHIVDGRKVESKFAVPRQRPNTPSSLASHATAKRDSPNAEQQETCSYPSTPQHHHHRPTISPFPQDLSHSSISSTGSGGGEIVNNKIFVGGLKYATNAEVLTRFFEEMFGEVDSAQIILNRDTKKSRGFGFVIFTHPQTVDMVLHRQNATPLMIEGKQVEVRACTARHTMPPQTPIHMLASHQQQSAPTPLSMITEQELSLNSSNAGGGGNYHRNSPWTPMMNNRMSFESPPSSSPFPTVFRPQATYTPRPLFPTQQQSQQQQHNSLLHQFQQQQQFHDQHHHSYNPPPLNPDLGLFDMSVVGNQLPSPSLSAASSSPHFQRRLSDQQQMHGFVSPLPPPTMGFRPPGQQQQQYRSVVPQHQENSLFGDPVMFPSEQEEEQQHTNSLFSTPDPSIFTSPSKPSSGNNRNDSSSPRNELSRSPVMNGGLSFSSFGTQTIW